MTRRAYAVRVTVQPVDLDWENEPEGVANCFLNEPDATKLASYLIQHASTMDLALVLGEGG